MSHVTDVCICLHVFVINESKHPFQDLRDLINYIELIYSLNHRYFCHVGLYFFSIHKWCGDMWSLRSCNLIAIVDRHLCEGVRGALLFVDESFSNSLISTVIEGVITVEIKVVRWTS